MVVSESAVFQSAASFAKFATSRKLFKGKEFNLTQLLEFLELIVTQRWLCFEFNYSSLTMFAAGEFSL